MEVLDGKVSDITGGAGKESVRPFAEEGERVVTAGIQDGEGRRLGAAGGPFRWRARMCSG